MTEDQSITVQHNGSAQGEIAHTEVAPQARGHRFTAAHKRRILDQVEGCAAPGHIGALPRREVLYLSHLISW